jgi:hypothetical protein
MAMITTFVCDVSGKVGPAEEFLNIGINLSKQNYAAPFQTVSNFSKLIHIDVARKLNLVLPPKGVEAQPEPTLESKLLVLLKEYITDIAYEAGSEGAAEAVRHSGGM